MKTEERNCGILLHPTSLPSRHGIGSLGDEAIKFIDLLSEMKVSLWQILPLGPTGFGDSPYASRSAFAGNELMIDLTLLAFDGYLELSDIIVDPFMLTDRIDYNAVREYKEPLLEKAALSLLDSEDKKDFNKFCKENKYWLDDYALYTILVKKFNDSRWFLSWDEDLKKRKKSAITKVKSENKEKIEIVKAIQYFFFKQWHKVKEYANSKNIQIIGDIPIFVAGDSVDAWTNVELFKMDEDYRQIYSAGVPPDAFSDLGQLWGNPVYDWDKHVKTDFAWWTKRIEATMKMCDIVRIDHFRGLESYWEVLSSETTALNGKWVKAPGQLLLDHLKKSVNNLNLIAEDLGVITEEVEELRDFNNLPGMKILQFAFGYKDGKLDSKNAYLPHHCNYNSVVYTGTHDNDTTRGWFDKLDDGTKDLIRRYYESSNEDIVFKMIRNMFFTNSKWAILPMQDFLELDSKSRMNTPSTCGSSNWSWRLTSLSFEDWRINRFKDIVEMSDRA
ncbi:MAG: 4-alpha-glucanotransferase [Pleomorphochaeta sp.]